MQLLMTWTMVIKTWCEFGFCLSDTKSDVLFKSSKWFEGQHFLHFFNFLRILVLLYCTMEGWQFLFQIASLLYQSCSFQKILRHKMQYDVVTWQDTCSLHFAIYVKACEMGWRRENLNLLQIKNLVSLLLVHTEVLYNLLGLPCPTSS